VVVLVVVVLLEEVAVADVCVTVFVTEVVLMHAGSSPIYFESLQSQQKKSDTPVPMYPLAVLHVTWQKPPA